MVLWPPRVWEEPPPLLCEYFVYTADATDDALPAASQATAFTVTVELTENIPAYAVPAEQVGVEPSVV